MDVLGCLKFHISGTSLPNSSSCIFFQLSWHTLLLSNWVLSSVPAKHLSLSAGLPWKPSLPVHPVAKWIFPKCRSGHVTPLLKVIGLGICSSLFPSVVYTSTHPVCQVDQTTCFSTNKACSPLCFSPPGQAEEFLYIDKDLELTSSGRSSPSARQCLMHLCFGALGSLLLPLIF